MGTGPFSGVAWRTAPCCGTRKCCSSEELEVVFRASDTSGSGGLDHYDLWFALHAVGLYPDEGQLGVAFRAAGLDFRRFREGDELELDFKYFKEVVAYLDSSYLCASGPKLVPYARRGVTFRQLQDFKHAYVVGRHGQPGWVTDQCRARGLHQVADLYMIDELVIKPVTSKDPQRRAGIPEQCLVAAQTPCPPCHDCSYAELVNPEGVVVDYFVSHWWGHEFAKTVKALGIFVETQMAQRRPFGSLVIPKTSAQDIAFWICLFSLNQSIPADELGSSPERGPFHVALAKASVGVVMVLDNTVRPFHRIWCLFEVGCIQKAREKNFCLVTDEGPLGGVGPVCLQRSESGSVQLPRITQEVASKLQHLSAYKAKASEERDRLAILFRIKDDTWSSWSFDTFREKLRSSKDSANRCLFHDFDARVSALLSTPMLYAMLWNSKRNPWSFDLGGAIKQVMLGATYDEDGVKRLAEVACDLVGLRADAAFANGAELSPVHVNAYFGKVDQMRLILDRGGDAGSRASDDRRPLHFASGQGHCSIVQLLLDYRAQVDDADARQRTALHLAAECGKAGVVLMLLRQGAAASAQDGSREGPLHKAASRGHRQAAAALLDLRAVIDAINNNQHTPLHKAAAAGHCEFAHLLMNRGASVTVADKGGKTSLHLAVQHGHAEVVQLLAAGTPDVDVPDRSGERPLHLAAARGRTDIIVSLLDSRASVNSVNNCGDTLLHKLAANGDYSGAELLVQRKALVSVRNKRGIYPVKYAKAGSQLSELLRINGARS